MKSCEAVLYARVSTIRQGDEGHSLEAQLRTMREYCSALGYPVIHEHQEVGSAKNLEREGLKDAIDMVCAHNGRTLVVVKLDRLTRSVADLSWLMDNVPFVSVRDSIDTGTASGRLVANIMGAVAEWERCAISERTKDGMAEARRKGVRLGRPATEFPSPWQAATAMKLREDGKSLQSIADHVGLKVSTVRRIV